MAMYYGRITGTQTTAMTWAPEGKRRGQQTTWSHTVEEEQRKEADGNHRQIYEVCRKDCKRSVDALCNTLSLTSKRDRNRNKEIEERTICVATDLTPGVGDILMQFIMIQHHESITCVVELSANEQEARNNCFRRCSACKSVR